jgi:DNA-binding NarL/FixJ family response regulator
VLRLLAQGNANKEICAELNLAEVTVKKHVQSLIGKLGVSDRTQAAIIGVRLGVAQ